MSGVYGSARTLNDFHSRVRLEGLECVEGLYLKIKRYIKL